VLASPLDTFRGLPVHALVLHLTVVAVPLMAVVTAALPWRRSWRRRFAWPVVVLDGTGPMDYETLELQNPTRLVIVTAGSASDG